MDFEENKSGKDATLNARFKDTGKNLQNCHTDSISLTRNPSFTFIDLFAGAGGLSLGLEQAGFTPIFVNEIVPQFNETYRKNRNLSDDQYFVGDIKELNEKLMNIFLVLKTLI